jgi:tetrahydromethanopterin S-methyltransferase subunit B
MDNSSGMQRRDGWTWKVWVGIVVGLAVVALLIILIANAGGGSGGIY